MKLTVNLYKTNGILVDAIVRHVRSAAEAREIVDEIDGNSIYVVDYWIMKSPAEDFVVALEELSESYEDNREFVDSLCKAYGLASIGEVAAKARELL